MINVKQFLEKTQFCIIIMVASNKFIESGIKRKFVQPAVNDLDIFSSHFSFADNSSL